MSEELPTCKLCGSAPLWQLPISPRITFRERIRLLFKTMQWASCGDTHMGFKVMDDRIYVLKEKHGGGK